MTAPSRTLDQRRTALVEANRIRTVRAALKRDLKAGRIAWPELLDHPDTATMKVLDALLHVPGIGRVKATRALRDAGVSPSKTLAGMTRRQATELELALPPAARTPDHREDTAA